jgi:hypothetical protein
MDNVQKNPLLQIIHEMFGSSNSAVNIITWLIHFAFNEAECLGKQQLKHCTF